MIARGWVLAGLVNLIAIPVGAAPGEGDGFRARNPERMKKILEQFDHDGDGQLSQQERQAAREARGGKRGEGFRDRRRRDGPGQKGPRMDPEALFRQADQDNDGQLSLMEFRGLMEQMQSYRGGDRARRGPSKDRPRGPRPGNKPSAQLENSES